jgi:hypothetical protein
MSILRGTSTKGLLRGDAGRARATTNEEGRERGEAVSSFSSSSKLVTGVPWMHGERKLAVAVWFSLFCLTQGGCWIRNFMHSLGL